MQHPAHASHVASPLEDGAALELAETAALEEAGTALELPKDEEEGVALNACDDVEDACEESEESNADADEARDKEDDSAKDADDAREEVVVSNEDEDAAREEEDTKALVESGKEEEVELASHEVAWKEDEDAVWKDIPLVVDWDEDSSNTHDLVEDSVRRVRCMNNGTQVPAAPSSGWEKSQWLREGSQSSSELHGIGGRGQAHRNSPNANATGPRRSPRMNPVCHELPGSCTEMPLEQRRAGSTLPRKQAYFRPRDVNLALARLARVYHP